MAPPTDDDTDRRRVFEFAGERPGPTLVITAGIHGNEPAGLHAIGRVHERLIADGVEVRGTIVGFAGNRQALARGVRYIERDLNRGWEVERIDRLLADRRGHAAEDLEQSELALLLIDEERRARGPLALVDLHTTSAASQPFVCMADTLRNRPLAFAMGLPVVLGLEEVIDGSMLGWLVDRGHSGIAVEGGQHEAAEAVEVHEAVVWVALHAAGCIVGPPHVMLAQAQRRLRAAAADLPRVLEIRHRQVVGPSDAFVMASGFTSFVSVRRGQVLAHDRTGPIHCSEDALLLMPRYQPQGEDGFFLAREVRGAWLTLSAWLRSVGAARLLPLIPGVRRDTAAREQLVVERHWPWRLTVDLMHLFGYRRVRPGEGGAVYSRRRPDARDPSSR